MKKKKLQKRQDRRKDGLLLIFQSESRYNGLYRDAGQLVPAKGATILPIRHWGTQQDAAIQPHDMANKGHDTAGLRAGASSLRAHVGGPTMG